ncbi:hypothetical protein EZS27_007264 [termite gut metagenome]|uniref:Uncharacterized protein n=1 Tax=termite gut metagenome TaxID=433724 RepID=A0A5J4SIR9_9ZZZZ
MINVKIKKYSGGEHEIYTSSHGEWERFISDLREPLQMLTSNPSLKDDKYFLALITDELGYYVGVLKPLRGAQRPDDHLAGWLFFANNLQISGEELKSKILLFQKELDKEVCDTNILESICNRRNISEKKYPDTLPQKNHINKQYAFRLYGQGTQYNLEETLNCLNQHYYQEYTAIFLLENKPELRIQGMTNLTDKKFEEYLILSFLPEIPSNCSVYINNIEIGRNKPFSLTKGNSLSIKVKKRGFEDILLEYNSNNQTKDSQILLLPLSWKRRISDDEDISNAQVILKNRKLTSNGELFLEDDLRNPNQNCIHITASGYEERDVSFDVDSLSKENPEKIKLEREEKGYKLYIPLRGCDKCLNCNIISRNEKLKESPIKGYNLLDRVGVGKNEFQLHYAPFYPLKKLSGKIILIVSIILLLLAGYLGGNWMRNTFFSSDNNLNNKLNQGKEPITESPKIPEYVNYLKANAKWNKQKMGTYSEIEDLWDDLNNRDFDKILEQWNVKLSKSNIPLWNQLIKKIEELKESEPDKYKKFQGKVYNSDTNDHDITISAYLTNLVSVHIDDHSTNRQQGNQNREQNSQRKSDDGIGSLDD